MKTYIVELSRRAYKDLEKIPLRDRETMLEKLELLSRGLQGDVKRLTDHTPEYRLRSGDWRALFDVEEDQIVIYRIRHRSDAYR